MHGCYQAPVFDLHVFLRIFIKTFQQSILTQKNRRGSLNPSPPTLLYMTVSTTSLFLPLSSQATANQSGSTPSTFPIPADRQRDADAQRQTRAWSRVKGILDARAGHSPALHGGGDRVEVRVLLCDVHAQLGVERVHGERGDDVQAHERDHAGCVLGRMWRAGWDRCCIR